MQKKNKGIVLTISTVLEGLFVVGVIAFLYWFFLSRVLEIHVTVNEATIERHAINLANVLISSEKLAYEEDGKISRGILDSSKLDSVFVRKDKFLEEVINQKSFPSTDIGIGYPNTWNLVDVIDLETCQSSGCDGWIISLSGPVSLQGLSTVKFVNCLVDNIKVDIGSLFRYNLVSTLAGPIAGPVAGIAGALWQPLDIEKCVKNTIPASINSIFTGTPISSRGLPVLIRYPNGDLHIGKIIVGVGEWT